jgi:hypothetical protein
MISPQSATAGKRIPLRKALRPDRYAGRIKAHAKQAAP